MTLGKWMMLYREYKRDYDMEYMMQFNKIRYSDIENKNNQEHENTVAF